MIQTLVAAALVVAAAVQPDFDTMLLAGTRALVEAMLSGRPGPMVAKFDDEMKAALTEAQLTAAVTTVLQQAGAFRGVTDSQLASRDGARLVVLACDFANGPVDITVVWSGQARVAGLNIRPATVVSEYTPPAYVTYSRFKESSVTIDAGTGWPLPGTLTMPTGDGPFPAVVLVHGSGPGDRDESLGPNRPFRDIAWGLASRGIAVLRYDKRTLAHRARIAALTSFTVKDETIDDAVAAAALLRTKAGIRADRIFVAGHSLGGMLAPRIGAADPKLGGLISLAGAVRPLEDSILAQTRYLAEVDGTVTDAEKTQIAAAQDVVTKARALKPGDPPLTGPLASGPASYIIDLRGYDPPAAAKALALPMLILQGERDYQVTMDDFAAWRAALGTRSDVRFTSYPALNHLLIAGTGKSTPAEYQTAGHVDEAVVRDIAVWVLAR
jgi:dienelactone hydrolase